MLTLPDTLSCTSCGSSQTRRVSLVHAEGVSTSTSVSTGMVIGRDGIGVGGGTTTGTSVTELSQRLAPPSEFTWIRNVVLRIFAAGIVGGLIGNASTVLGAIIVYGGIAGSIWLARNERRFNRVDLPRLLSEWQRSYLCTRCGNTFVPAS